MEKMNRRLRDARLLKMDKLVTRANERDTLVEAEARRALVEDAHQSCNCQPPALTPRYVLQPSALPPKPLAADSIRPGGWFNDALDAASNWIDDTADTVAEVAGGAVCDFLDGTGIKDEAEQLNAAFLEMMKPGPSGQNAAQWLTEYVAGGVPFFVSELIETCNIGPSLKTFAAVEARRMTIAASVLTTMGTVAGIAGVAAAAPTAGVALIPAAKAYALAALATSLAAFWASVAVGEWPSYAQLVNIYTAVSDVDKAAGGAGNPLAPEMKEAIEAVDLQEAEALAAAAIEMYNDTNETLQVVQAAVRGTGEFVRSGSIAPAPSPIQPTRTAPQLSMLRPAPNPLVVRTPVDTKTLAPLAPTQILSTIDTSPKKPEGGGPIPLIGLGLLLDLVL